MDAYTLGWIVPWGAPDAFVKHLNPAKSDPTQAAPEAYNYWADDTEVAQRAVEAWQTIQNNRAPTDEAEQARNEAAVTMEEANSEAVANLPVYHESEERFSYQWADFPTFGEGGTYRQKYNEVTLDDLLQFAVARTVRTRPVRSARRLRPGPPRSRRASRLRDR